MHRIHAVLVGFALLFGGSAAALGVNYGARLGIGPGFGSGNDAVEDADFNSLVLGAAVKLDLVLLGLEVDVLWNQVNTDNDTTASSISTPIIGTFSFPLVPLLFDLNAGLGLEPRFHLSTTVDGTEVKDDPTEDMVLYLPVVLGGTLNLPILDVDLQIRYLHQLTESQKDSDVRVHHLLFMAGAFF